MSESKHTPGPWTLAPEPDLEPTAFDWNKPFQARDGRKARRVSDKGKGLRKNIIIYEMDGGFEGVEFVRDDGRRREFGGVSRLDLVNIEPPRASLLSH